MILETLTWTGRDLVRPECVLATARGDLFTADGRGGVTHIRPDGSQILYAGTLPDGRKPRPNGIALRPNGNFLMANLGEERGGVFELSRNGVIRSVLERVDGIDLPPTNFVHEDANGRIWVTVSTRLKPRAAAYRADVADGFIVLIDGHGARVVAEGIGYTNEALPSPDGNFLYVNETFARKLTRYRLTAAGDLHSRETVAQFGAGTFPDGLAFDAEGGVWIVSVVSNRVIRVYADGRQEIVLEDSDAAHLEAAEQAYVAGTMGRTHLDTIRSKKLRNISSLAFGGPDLRTAYLGCLLGDTLATFRAPVAGAPPVHWNY